MPSEWFERNKTVFVAVLLVAVVGLQVAQFVSGGAQRDAFVATPTPQASGAPKVYASGAVGSPGVYEFERGDRVERAIELAGGASADADLDRTNLAGLLADEQHVHVPAKGEQAVVRLKVDVNRASAEELAELPGIGPVTAEKIVAYRRLNGPLRSLDDLAAAGLTATQLDAIKELVLFRL